MKSKLKTSLLAILLALFTVCTLLFCVQAFPVNSANAEIAPVTEKGTTHVLISADKTNVSAGGTVTFTLTITSTRSDMEWYSTGLDLSPMDADLKYADMDVAKCLSVVSHPSTETDSYSDFSSDKFATTGGAQYVISKKSGATTVSATNSLTKSFVVKFSEDLPSSVTSIKFGFPNTAAEKVTYCVSGVMGIADQAKKSTKSGQLTYEPLIINVAPASNECDLTALKVGHGSPSTSVTPAEAMTYTTSSSTLNNFIVQPTVSAGASCKVGLTSTPTDVVTSGSNSKALTISPTNNKVYFLVTAESGTSKTYVLTISFSHVRLSALTVSGNTTKTGSGLKNGLSTAFSEGTFAYTANIPDDATTVTIKPTVKANFGINTSIAVTATGCTAAATVNSGSNLSVTGVTNSSKIELTATANDGTTTQKYTISFAILSTNTNITLTGTGVTSNKTYTPTQAGTTYTIDLDGESKCKLNITAADTNATIKVGSANYSSTAEYGAGTQTVTVTAPAGNTATYSVKINSAAAAAALTSLQYSFDGTTYKNVFDSSDYDAATNTFDTTVNIADVPVNNMVYFKAEASFGGTIAPTGLNLNAGVYSGSLKFGENNFALRVNGTGTANYPIKITLVENKNTIDSMTLTLNGTPVSGFTFNSATESYDVTVPYSSQPLNVSMKTDGVYAYVYNGSGTKLARTDTNGTHTDSVKLNEGSNTITYYAKSNNGAGEEGKHYTLNITMEASEAPKSSNYEITGIKIVGADGTVYFPGEYGENGARVEFSKDTHSYKIYLPHGVEHVTVTADADPTAFVNGAGSIDLEVGNTSFDVYAVAEDGSNSNGAEKYSFVINREAPVEFAYLANLQINGTTVAGFNKNVFTYSNFQSSTTESVVVTATAEVEAATVEIKVNGVSVGNGTSVATGNVAMGAVGKTVTAVIEVTLEGTTTTYELNLTKASDVPLLTYLYVGGYEIYDANGNLINGDPANQTEFDVLGHTTDFYITIGNEAEIFIEARTADATAELRVDEHPGKGDFNLTELFGEGLTGDLHVVIRPVLGADSVYTIHLKRPVVPSTNTDADIIIDEIKDFNEVYTNTQVVYGNYTVPYNVEELGIHVTLHSQHEAEVPATYKIFYNYELKYEFGYKKDENGKYLKDSLGGYIKEENTVSDLTLKCGFNIVYIEITASDGVTKKTVVAVVNREVVNHTVKISEIAKFNEEFAKDRTMYGSYGVSYRVSDLDITVDLDRYSGLRSVSSYQIFYNNVLKNDNGSVNRAVKLNYGLNYVNVKIITDGEVVSSYDIIVERADVSLDSVSINEIPDFANDYVGSKTEYIYTVGNDITNLTFIVKLGSGYYYEFENNTDLKEGLNIVYIHIYEDDDTYTGTLRYLLTDTQATHKVPVKTITLNVYREVAATDGGLIWIILFFILLLIVIIETIVIICMIPRLRRDRATTPVVITPSLAPVPVPQPMVYTPAPAPMSLPVYQPMMQTPYIQPTIMPAPIVQPPVYQQPIIQQPIIQAIPQQRYVSGQQPVNVEVRLNGFNDDDGFYDQYGRKY